MSRSFPQAPKEDRIPLRAASLSGFIRLPLFSQKARRHPSSRHQTGVREQTVQKTLLVLSEFEDQ